MGLRIKTGIKYLFILSIIGLLIYFTVNYIEISYKWVCNYNYKLFTGFGITESLFNNPTFLSLKQIFRY